MLGFNALLRSFNLLLRRYPTKIVVNETEASKIILVEGCRSIHRWKLKYTGDARSVKIYEKIEMDAFLTPTLIEWCHENNYRQPALKKVFIVDDRYHITFVFRNERSAIHFKMFWG